MSDSNEVVTDPRLEKRTRRRFSVAEKKRLLVEAEALPYDDNKGHPKTENFSEVL